MPDILAIIGADTALKRTSNTNGGEYHGACPMCGGTDRFIVWPTPTDGAPRFWCRQCDAKGDTIAYLRLRGMTYREACDQLQIARPAAPAKRKPKEPLPYFAEQLIKSYEQDPARYDAWLEYRGLRAETVDKFRLGFGRLPGEEWAHSEPGLILPVFDARGACRCLRARNSKGWLTKGGSTLYAPLGLPIGAIVVIIENCANACLIAQATEFIPIAPTCGASAWSPDWPIWVAARAPRAVFIYGDADKAGEKMGRRWAAALEKLNIVAAEFALTEDDEMELMTR